MGKTADLAIGLRGLFKVQAGKCMCLGRIGLDSRLFQQVFAHQVRHAADRVANAQVNAGLAEVDRLELGVAISEMQEMDIAKAWDVVQHVFRRRGKRRLCADHHATGCSDSHDLHEFTSVHTHMRFLTVF